LTADSLDTAAIQKIASPPPGKKLGSLKSLENLLASKTGAEPAGKLLAPLFYVYDLRHADAHLPGGEAETAFQLIGVDRDAPFVFQGFQLLDAVVGCIFAICKVLGDEKSGKAR
jgi:hypothetical protein